MSKPVDRHGFPIPDRLLPLHPDPLSITAEQAAEMRRARGDHVSANPGANIALEALRGADFRPPESRDRLFKHFQARDPLAALKEQVKQLQAQVVSLKAARTWRTDLPPLAYGADDPHEVGPVVSGWVLVKTAHGRQYTAELHDWRIDPEDEPNPKWVMAGRDGYTIDDVTGWMPLPEDDA